MACEKSKKRRGFGGRGGGVQAKEKSCGGAGIADDLPMRHSDRGPQEPQKPGKTVTSTGDGWVRNREAGLSRFSAITSRLVGVGQLVGLLRGKQCSDILVGIFFLDYASLGHEDAPLKGD
jgi:hypothetical protein